jgi:tetratricopeptide (TPR) repeat protein
VLEQEPVSPRQLNAAVDRDLETICLKCLQKEPSRRYPSAAALAGDLERYLAGRPITARPLSRAARLARWCRRHPRTALLSGALAAAVCAGLVATTLLWRLAESRRKLADETARQARSAVHQHFVLATEHPEFQRDGMGKAREILLDQALAYFREFARLRGNDAALRADVADAHRRVGMILALRGSAAEAQAEFQRALAIYHDLHARQPHDPALREALAKVLGRLADVESNQGQLPKALERQARAVELCAALASDFPRESRFQQALADSRAELGFLYHKQGNNPAALRELDAAKGQLAELHAASPSQETARSLADCLVGLGHVHWQANRPADAVPAYEQAVALRERLLSQERLPHDRSELARTYGSLGQALAELDRGDEALARFRQALALREELFARNPEVVEYRYDLALSCKQVADELVGRGQFDEAFELRQEALAHFQRLVEINPGNTAYRRALMVAHGDISWLYRRHKSQPAKALQHLARQTEMGEDLLERKLATPAHRLTLAEGYAQTGLLYLQQQEYPRAMESFGRSNRVLGQLLAEQAQDAAARGQLSTNYVNMGYCEQQTGRWEPSLHHLAKALLAREELVRTHPQVPQFRRDLEKTRGDLAASAGTYIQQLVPLDNSRPP